MKFFLTIALLKWTSIYPVARVEESVYEVFATHGVSPDTEVEGVTRFRISGEQLELVCNDGLPALAEPFLPASVSVVEAPPREISFGPT